MFEYIKGKVIDVTNNTATVDVNGIGYRLMIPLNISAPLAIMKEQALFFVSFVVREDSHTLYGFLKKEARDLFELLLTLSGIGPKTALAIVGHLEINNLQAAIAKGDVFILSKVPGIGKKTAQKLIIELKDKFKFATLSNTSLNMQNNVTTDALNALINLGYGMHEAKVAIDKVLEKDEKDQDVSALIASAIRNI
jgi:Holliday junction DNA helicase RuvA